MLNLKKMGTLALAFTGLGAVQAATVNATTAGWNLLGYSDASDVVVADAFGDKTKVTTVWKWTGAGWAFYSPDLADGGQAYAGTKGYDFLTTLKSGDGFWVNAKATFSATLPAPAAPVNAAALAGITTTLTTFHNQFATAQPTSTAALTPLVDDTFLNGGGNKTNFLAAMLTPGNGPTVGASFVNIALVNPTDSGAVPNDASHQWFTFSESTGGGPGSAWLAIKNAAGNWLVAGNQRLFDFNTKAQAVKHVPAVGSVITYNNQINADVQNTPAGVTQVILTGPGVTPATGITIYSGGNKTFPQTCGIYGYTTNCIDPSAASAGSLYTAKVYTTAGGASVPAYTYANKLEAAPLANLAGAAYASNISVSGSWASGSNLTVSWTLPAGSASQWISASGWNQNSQVFNVGSGLSSSQTSAQLTVPSYSATPTSKNIWLEIQDASKNSLAVDYQQ